MHQSATTVAFYDTLGPEATRFMLHQTELTSIAISIDFVAAYTKLKAEDAKMPEEEQKCFRLKNLIVFEDAITGEEHAKAREEAEAVGITVHSLSAVI